MDDHKRNDPVDPFDEAEAADEQTAEAGSDEIPAYRFIYEPPPRRRPISRMLARAVKIHRALVLYYMRPVFRLDDEASDAPRIVHWPYLGCKCGGPAIIGFSPDEQPAEEVLSQIHCLAERVRQIEDTSRTYGLVAYDSPEPPPPPEDPAANQKPLLLGWQVHPSALEPLEACRTQIRELVDVLLDSDHDQSISAILDHIHSASTLRFGPVIGYPGDDLVTWDHPHDLQRSINQMHAVAAFEQELVAGGWVPVWPDEAKTSQVVSEVDAVWSNPMSKTAIAKLVRGVDYARPRDFDQYVVGYYEVEQITVYKWKIRLDKMTRDIRERFENEV